MTATDIRRYTQSAEPVARPAVAQLTNIVKRYGERKALDRVNFGLGTGEVVALLGANGAGKTTIMRLLLGLASPTQGTVRVFGGDPKARDTRTHIGAMLQIGKVPETLRVKEHIDLFSSYYPRPLPLAETLTIARLKGIEMRQFGDLSGGQKQRVLFALAICGDPDVLLLDEPTVGLDVEARLGMWQQIRALTARGKTVLLTTHYLEEADALASRVIVIDKGRIIAEGPPDMIKTRTLGKRIHCTTTVSLEALKKMDGVIDIKANSKGIEIRTCEAEAVVRELLLRDPQLSGLEVLSAGMEDAFLALTHPAPEDFQVERQKL